mmetsp:Transcript_65382/g.141912  ORF Transcript_65382/g.141912 Transcript_65382/m.141912 type:complete len:98 (-) Transcript_65382:1020-1313(-)
MLQFEVAFEQRLQLLLFAAAAMCVKRCSDLDLVGRSTLTFSSCSAQAIATTRNSSSIASEVNHFTGGQLFAPQFKAKCILWSHFTARPKYGDDAGSA